MAGLQPKRRGRQRKAGDGPEFVLGCCTPLLGVQSASSTHSPFGPAPPYPPTGRRDGKMAKHMVRGRAPLWLSCWACLSSFSFYFCKMEPLGG